LRTFSPAFVFSKLFLTFSNYFLKTSIFISFCSFIFPRILRHYPTRTRKKSGEHGSPLFFVH